MPHSAARTRCAWATDALCVVYHDCEWGVPVHDDRLLFEFLILEGAQAGLSWTTILKKRENYRRAFDNFDAQRIQICWFHDLLRFHASRRPGERSLAGLFPVFANQGRRVALKPKTIHGVTGRIGAEGKLSTSNARTVAALRPSTPSFSKTWLLLPTLPRAAGATARRHHEFNHQPV